MIVLKPTTAIPKDLYTTRLYFENGVYYDFYMKGAIAWPEGELEGFAILAGQDTHTKHIVIFEEFPFWTVEHWLNDDDTIHARDDGTGYHLGLVQFIQDNFSKYKCASYFWGDQHRDVWKRFGTATYRNPMLPKQIELIEVPYVKKVGDNLKAEYLNLEMTHADTGSRLLGMLQSAEIQENNGDHAFKVLLAGFEYAPWVKT